MASVKESSEYTSPITLYTDNYNIQSFDGSLSADGNWSFLLNRKEDTAHTKTVTQQLAPGETLDIKEVMDLSKINTATTLTVSVVAAGETNIADNIQTLSVGQTDISVTLSKQSSQDAVLITANIKNESTIGAEVTTTLYTDATGGTKVKSQHIGVISGKENKSYTFSLNKTENQLKGSESKYYHVVVTTTGKDYNEENNTDMIALYAEDVKLTSVPKGNTAKKPPLKGSVRTIGAIKYKVTKSAKKNGKVSVVGVKSKKVKKLVVPKTVKINGYTFDITSIATKAFKKCKNLKNIKISTTKLKSVGKGALKGIHKKCVIKVPKKQLTRYKKIWKGKGQKKTVKILRY